MRRTLLFTIIVVIVTSLINPNPVFCESGFKDYSYLLPDYLHGSSNYINLEAVDEYNNIWININNELWKLNSERTELVKIELPQEYTLVRFKAGKDNNYYLMINYGELIQAFNPIFTTYDGNYFGNFTDFYIDSLKDSLTTDYEYSNMPGDFFLLKENTFMFSSYNYLLKYDGLNYDFFRMPSDFGYVSRDNMTIDKNNNIIMAISDKGIASFNGTEWKTNFIEGGLPFGSNHIYIDKKGNIWVFGRGAAKYDGSSWEVFMNKFTDDDYETIPFYFCMAQDNQSRYWFGHNFGIIIYDGIRFTNYTYIDTNIKTNLYLFHIETIIADNNGNIWFCYYSGGNDYKLICYENSLSVKENGTVPSEFGLTNYPNPFNPSTTISFSIPETTDVKIIVYNVAGQKVSTLVDGPMSAGVHSVRFDGSDLGSGLYFYKFESAKFDKAGKFMLVK